MKHTKIFGADDTEVFNPAPEVVGVKPTGSQILVELLHAQEVLGGSIIVGEKTEFGAPQAYVLAVGPSLKAEEFGIKVGDRVLVQGSFVPVPQFDGRKRKLGVMELHNIKAVLEEKKCCGGLCTLDN